MKEKYRQGDQEVIRRLDLLLQDICKQYAACLNHAKWKYEEAMDSAKEAIAKDNAEKEYMPAAICARFRKAMVIYLINPEIDLATCLESGHPKDINGMYLWKGESKIGLVNEPLIKEL